MICSMISSRSVWLSGVCSARRNSTTALRICWIEHRLVRDLLERLEIEPLDEPAVQVDLELVDRARDARRLSS